MLKNTKQLLAISADLGYTKPANVDIHSYFRRKVTKLYQETSFKKFLDAQTSFLPKSFAVGIERWYYYINGDTTPHLCPACNRFISIYKDKFCCHTCSTKYRDSSYAKTGPKVDLGKKEVEFRNRMPKGYKLKGFGAKRSTVVHSVCKSVLEVDNYRFLKGGVKCSCEHKRVIKHTLSTLKDRYSDSVWIPIKYAPGRELATFKNKECGHKVDLPWSRDFDLRCPTCFPNKLGTRVKTAKQYKEELALAKPEFKLLGKYVDSRTTTKYKHLDCGASFEATPGEVQRKAFRCPACAPKTCGSFYVFKYRGHEFKVRGKEAVAVHWVLNNTSVKPASIELDSDKTIPSVAYRFNRKRCYYYPDIFIRDRNILVEVKSLTTIGLAHDFFYVKPKTLWDRTCAKAKACLDAGYKFQMLVFSGNNTRIKLPKDWYDYSHKEIVKWFNSRLG